MSTASIRCRVGNQAAECSGADWRLVQDTGNLDLPPEGMEYRPGLGNWVGSAGLLRDKDCTEEPLDILQEWE